ncbi:MAG: OsmC family protein [Pseudomonadota bacterium]
MSDNRFRFAIRQLDNFQFQMNWDLAGVEPLLTDEPAPLGAGSGPNPARVLAASVANCLSASLLFALRKYKDQPSPLIATVEAELARNDNNRWRIAQLQVDIQLADASEALPHLARALAQFEDFCVVTESVRHGIPVAVSVRDGNGVLVKAS